MAKINDTIKFALDHNCFDNRNFFFFFFFFGGGGG